MTPDDLARLHAACFTTPRPWGAMEFADLMARPDVFLLTAPDAFLMGRALAGEAELLTLAVAPEARRKGTARALVAAFAEEARARGAEEAFLEVSAENAPARALYEATGWAEAGRRRDYYKVPDAAPVDALVLRLQLC